MSKHPIDRCFRLPAILFLLLPAVCMLSQNADISHDRYHEYEGTFHFADGSYITGGPMDEVPGSLLFMDPLRLKRGGLFRPVSQIRFQSFLDTSVYIRYDVQANGDVKGLWWEQSGQTPVYARKKAYHSVQQVAFQNGDVHLAGELYLPLTEGPHPLIIQVHGSGKQKRHIGTWNTLFPMYGIAVLTYDKRGSGASTGDFSTAGYADFASDVLAAIDFARQHPALDTTRIGLHGSSEGGWVSAIAAAYSDDLAFMIIRAGSGVSGSDTYMHEVKIELREKELTEEEYIQAVRFERTLQDMAAADSSLAAVNEYIRRVRRENDWFSKAFGDYDSMSPNYWIKLKKSGPVDPIPFLRQVSDIPVLWFLAEEDENVPYALSRPRLEVALAEAGNRDFEILSLPGANHAFLVSAPGGGLRYTDGYWTKMIEWLRERGLAE